jgi:S-DNA-T family DNA segregation ATPase FtsK/SpoIIIE
LTVSSNVGVRFALRVMDQWANDAVLGTSSYKNGIRATTLSPRDKGIGYLVGLGDGEPTVTRTFYVDKVAAERIALRARKAREAAGTLSGYALGDTSAPTTEPVGGSLLSDLATVFATITTEKVWSEDVCRSLGELRPGLYAGWTPESLATALRPLQIGTSQMWGTDETGDVQQPAMRWRTARVTAADQQT